MTGRHWLALAIVGSGAVSLGALVLFAKGRHEEAFALSFTAGLLSTTFSAARALAEDSEGLPRAGSSAAGSPTGWGVAGLAGTAQGWWL